MSVTSQLDGQFCSSLRAMVHIEHPIIEVLVMVKIGRELNMVLSITISCGCTEIVAYSVMLERNTGRSVVNPIRRSKLLRTSTQIFVEVWSSMRSVGAGDFDNCKLRKMTFVPF